MWISLLGIAIIGVIVLLGMFNIKKRTNFLKKLYPYSDIVESENYYVLEKKGIILVPKTSVKKENEHIKINSINEIKVYEDDKEASLGNAIVGSLNLDKLGSVVGLNMTAPMIKKMGIKIDTDKGAFDLKFISVTCKKGSIPYRLASDSIKNLISIFKKYQ